VRGARQLYGKKEGRKCGTNSTKEVRNLQGGKNPHTAVKSRALRKQTFWGKESEKKHKKAGDEGTQSVSGILLLSGNLTAVKPVVRPESCEDQ